MNVTRGKHQVGLLNRGVMWDTLVTECAGEEDDPLRKEHVIVVDFMKTVRQPTAPLKRKLRRIPRTEPRELDPIVLEPRRILRALIWKSGGQHGGVLDQRPRKAKNGCEVFSETTVGLAGQRRRFAQKN